MHVLQEPELGEVPCKPGSSKNISFQVGGGADEEESDEDETDGGPLPPLSRPFLASIKVTVLTVGRVPLSYVCCV